MEPEIFAALRGRVGHAHQRVDDEMPGFVGDHVEIQCVGKRRARIRVVGADLHVSVARVRVVQARQDGEFQALERPREVPADPPAGVTLPKGQHEPRGAEDVRVLEPRLPEHEVVEVAVRSRRDRRRHGAPPRGKGQ